LPTPSAELDQPGVGEDVPMNALLVLNRQEEFRRRASKSPLVGLAKAVAQGSAFVGITAAFWHMSMIAGIVFLAVGFVAVGVHPSGYVRLEYDSKFRSEIHSPQGL